MPGTLYPSDVDNNESLHTLVNNTVRTLAAPISTSDTEIELAPNANNIPEKAFAVLGGEVIYYSGHSGTHLQNVSRGQLGTSPSSHTTGAVIAWAYMAEHHNDLRDAIVAIQERVGLPEAGETQTLHEKVDFVAQQADRSHTHEEPVPNPFWIVGHQLGKFPSIKIIELTSGQEIEADEIKHIDTNAVTIKFTEPVAGKATCN